MSDRAKWKPLTPQFAAAIRKYDREGTTRLQAAETRYTVEAPLYHYTDRRGLEGIVASQQIWFTQYQHMNDPSEVEFGMQVARSLLDEVGTAYGPRIKFFCDMVADFLTTENMHGVLDLYTASISRARDDLTQWRAYAANGCGFALGLAPKLFAVQSTPRDQKPHENVFVAPVVYGENTGRLHHLPAVESAARIVKEVVEHRAKDIQDKNKGLPFFDEMAKRLIATELLLNCLTTKHGAYEHEQEVRLFILGMTDKLAPHISTRPRGTEIVPFIRSNMPLQRPDSIAEIVVGPAAREDSADFACALIAPFHPNPRSIVRKSTIPYRA